MLFNGKATDAVRSRPSCDVPGCEEPAAVDAATTRGSWGYFCISHHQAFCKSRLGQGAGQVLLCEDDYSKELKEWYDLEEEGHDNR